MAARGEAGEEQARRPVAAPQAPASAPASETAAPLVPGSTRSALALQRAAGNRATLDWMATWGPQAGAALQREVKNKEGILDGMMITKYSHAAEFLTTRSAELEKERNLILEDGAPAPASLSNTVLDGRGLAANCRGGGDKEIDEVTYDQVDAWYLKAKKAMDEGENLRLLLGAQKMREIKSKAQQAEKTALDTREQLADKRMAAFEKDEDSILSDLWNWSTALYDSALEIKPVIERSVEMEMTLRTAAHVGAAQAGPNVGKINASFKMPEGKELMPLLEKVNQAIAVIQIATAAAELISSKKSKAAKAKSDIKAAVSLAGAVGTLINVAAGISLMLNLHIGPMTDACMKALDALESVARKINRQLIEQGLYDKVNWDLEPGGRPLFDFMLKLRNAGGPEDVPSPVPKEVADYFTDNQGDIEAGATGNKKGDEMPTTGWWFWKDVDQAKIGKWCFTHRQHLWEIFYGRTRPDSA